jgi:hypothetical protein
VIRRAWRSAQRLGSDLDVLWVNSADDLHVGLHGDDVLWVLENAQAEVLVLRPAPQDTRTVGAHGIQGAF